MHLKNPRTSKELNFHFDRGRRLSGTLMERDLTRLQTETRTPTAPEATGVGGVGVNLHQRLILNTTTDQLRPTERTPTHHVREGKKQFVTAPLGFHRTMGFYLFGSYNNNFYFRSLYVVTNR